MTDSMPTRQVAPLPAPLTSFVGRERDIAHLSSLLRGEVRLVTLTGPGGVGKTRLALRVAHDFQGAFADGVAFVPLAPITDPDLVCSTIAQVLGVRERGDRSAPALLAEALRDREMLLILDNFEQIVEAAPQLTEVLAACPRLRLLVTSRILLRLSGEHDVPVRPLSLPDSTSSSRHVSDAEAVHLFVERARAADPTFTLADDNARAVTAICQRLDGLPLALELVAAKVRFLPPHALLPRLAQTLPLLTGGRRDDPVRLQTMRDAIAWSYDLLPAELQTLFTRLSVFAGGFTLEAAVAVAGVLEDTEINVLSGVESLLEHSLIHRVAGNGESNSEPRFGMLETVREFGLEQLEASDQEESIQARHAWHFLTIAEKVAPNLAGPHEQPGVERLDSEQANLRAALEYFRRRGCAEAFLRLANSLTEFWILQGRFREGWSQFQTGIGLTGPVTSAVRARALSDACRLADNLGDYDQAVTFGDESVAIWRTLNDRLGLANALMALSAALIQVDIARAEVAGNESVSLYIAPGEDRYLAYALGNLGVAAYARGDYTTAATHIERALAVARESSDPTFIGAFLGEIAHVAMVTGELRRSSELIGEALIMKHICADRSWVAWHLACLGGVARQSQPTRAATLFGAAAALNESEGYQVRPAVQAVYAPMLAEIRETLGDAAFAVSWEHGASLSLEEAIAEGMAIVNETAEPALPDQVPGLPFGLTPRESELLRLVAAGQSNSEIAAALYISVPTVKRHISTILRKLDLPSRPAAIAFAHTHGMA